MELPCRTNCVRSLKGPLHQSSLHSSALPYVFGVAPEDSVGQETGIDSTGAGLLTINPDININTLNNVGAGMTFLSCNCEEDSWTVKTLYDYKWNNSEYSSHQVSLLVGLKF